MGLSMSEPDCRPCPADDGFEFYTALAEVFRMHWFWRTPASLNLGAFSGGGPLDREGCDEYDPGPSRAG